MMPCSWCNGWNGVREVTTHVQSPLSRCGERSPFDPRATCRRERGHLGACRTDAPEKVTHLCSRCWGVWKESGERPPAYRMRSPDSGPIGGVPLDLSRLRR